MQHDDDDVEGTLAEDGADHEDDTAEQEDAVEQEDTDDEMDDGLDDDFGPQGERGNPDWDGGEDPDDGGGSVQAADAYRPHIGPAPDPYEERPAARKQALAPLLDPHPGASLAASPLRFLRGSGEEKLDLLLSLPDPAAVVQALSPEEYVFLIKDIGLNDSTELLMLASPRQLQACLDLDAWVAGDIDPTSISEWLLAAEEGGEDVVERFVAAQEDGLIALYLANSLKVYPTEDEPQFEVPDDMELFASPDGTMQIVCDPDDPHLVAVRLAIRTLYRLSVERGRSTLKALRWELPSQLSEDLYALRTSRLDELGFMEKDEAREMYGYRDPEAFRTELQATFRGTGTPEPGSLRPYLAQEDTPRLGLALREAPVDEFLPRALLLLPTEDRDRLRLGLTRLAYRTQSARAERPSELQELTHWATHALHTCSMGLQHLSGYDLRYAALILHVEPLASLFRHGHSLVLVEHMRARRLRTSLGGAKGIDRLEPADALLVRGMSMAFPSLPAPHATRVVAEDELPSGGVDPAWRPVASLEELGEAQRKLQGLGAVVAWVAALAGGDLPKALEQAESQSLNGAVRLSSLLATAVARHLLGGEAGLLPLSEGELKAFLRLAFVPTDHGRAVRPELRQKLIAAILAQPELDEVQVAALTGFVEAALERLGDELGGLSPDRDLDLRFVGGGVLVRK